MTYDINTDYDDFVEIHSLGSSNGIFTFLLDSGADISLIKLNALSFNVSIDNSEVVNMRGFARGMISSLGVVYIELQLNNIVLQHKFHVVSNEVAIPCDGIIGKDFIKLNQCNLDYRSMLFNIRLYDIEISVPMLSEPRRNKIYVPARSEIFRIFRFNELDFPRVIESQEIAPNILIPTTVVYSNEAWIRVLNTNDENIMVDNSHLVSNHISEFEIYQAEKQNPVSERTEKLKFMLKNRIPAYAPGTLISLCTEFSEIFALPGDKSSINNFYKQRLNLSDNAPVFVKNYRLPQSQKAEINKQVRELLANDLIEISQSSFNSPIIIVPKKSNTSEKKYRMCIDFRMLNRKLIPDKFPLPRIDEILDNLGRAKYFSILDLQSGFHQIPLENDSRACTAFSTDNGFYQWKVLPFGLSIAPSSFSRMMTIAFSGLKTEQAFIYMDDIIVIGTSESNHINNLRDVFGICKKYNLKLNPNKCEFMRYEVSFLGHRCTANGLLPDPNKLIAVKNYPKPKDKNEVKRFVAFANYYRRFIANFATLTKPLTELTGKRIEFNWTTKCDEAFESLKQKLIQPPILRYPDFSKPFTVTVDASQLGCGAMLSQSNGDNDLPITFISKTFKKGELNKPIIEKELMAIHYAVTQLRPYLYGRSFRVKSDHKPLIFLYNLKNPASKLTRLRLDLEEYDFVVEYIQGSKNVVADALSRISIQDLKNQCEHTEHILAITRSMSMNNKIDSKHERSTYNSYVANANNVKIVEEQYAPFSKHIPRAKTTLINTSGSIVNEIIISAYLKHKILFEIRMIEKLTLKSIISKLNIFANQYNVQHIQWPLNDKIFEFCTKEEFKLACNSFLTNVSISLINPPKIINDEKEKLNLIKYFHDDVMYGGHVGQKKLYAQLRSRYFWPRMTRDVANYVRKCIKCKLNKPQRKTKEPLVITDTPGKPFDVVIIDTIGPLQTSINGNQYALTMMCDFTKFLVAAPMPNKSAKAIAKTMFDHFILKFGPMKSIRSDLGTEFKNELINEICKMLNINHTKSTAYHHETLGTVERNHRVFNEYLRSYLDNDIQNWETYLNYFSFCYNMSKNSSNDLNYSPFELVYGRSINLPNEFNSGQISPVYNVDNYAKELKFILQKSHKVVSELNQKMKEQNKKHYDKKLNPLNIKTGDQIMIEIEPYHKHKPKYKGPFTVVNISEPNVEFITEDNKLNTIHKNRVKKF